MSAIYLLHFSRRYFHAQHYLGFCEADDPADRIAKHLSGSGSPLVAAAIAAGIGVRLAHVISPADRYFERRIKNRGSFRRWCPLCRVNHNTRPLPKFDPAAPLTRRMKRFGKGGIDRRRGRS